MIDKVKISSLSCIGENDKGKTFSGNSFHDGGFLTGFRKEGSVNGCHYHKGISPEKDPEILFFLQGKAELYCRDITNQQETTIVLENPTKVEIYPYVWHRLKALTDIVFLEMNSLEEHQKDTFYEPEFENFG